MTHLRGCCIISTFNLYLKNRFVRSGSYCTGTGISGGKGKFEVCKVLLSRKSQKFTLKFPDTTIYSRYPRRRDQVEDTRFEFKNLTWQNNKSNATVRLNPRSHIRMKFLVRNSPLWLYLHYCQTMNHRILLLDLLWSETRAGLTKLNDCSFGFLWLPLNVFPYELARVGPSISWSLHWEVRMSLYVLWKIGLIIGTMKGTTESQSFRIE